MTTSDMLDPATDSTAAETSAQPAADDAKSAAIYPAKSTAADIKKAFDAAKAQGADTALHAPQHWPDKDKALFTKLDQSTKQWLLQRHKEMEGNYTKKSMEIAEERKRYGELSQAFAPYRQDLEKLGLSETQAVNELLRLYKEQQQRGIATPLPDHPELQSIKYSVQQLAQVFTAQRAQQQELAIRFGMQKIKSLTDAKDETGQPRHRHFEKLLPTIVMLAHADLRQGREPQLDDLYERAKWTDPELRQQELAAQLSAAEQQQKAARQTKRQAAAKAGSSVYGASDGTRSQARPQRTLREELEAAFRDSAAG